MASAGTFVSSHRGRARTYFPGTCNPWRRPTKADQFVLSITATDRAPFNRSTSSMTDILPILVALVLTAIWIAVGHASRRERLRKLGDNVEEIALYRRWVRWAQGVLLALSVALPVVAVIMFDGERQDLGELFANMIRSLWLVSMVYGMQQSGTIAIGSKGFIYGQQQPVAWDDVQSIAWDRDIGQRQWGCSVSVERGKRIEKLRFYVKREHKPTVEKLFERHLPEPTGVPGI